MPKNQDKPKAKKYRRDRNHAEFLDNIEFFSIILKNPLKLVYQPPSQAEGYFDLFRYQSISVVRALS